LLVALFLILDFAALWWLPNIAAAVQSASAHWPLLGRPSLSHRELVLYRRLAAMYPDHLIFTHVSLSELMGGMHEGSRVTADFVVCRQDLSIVSVIVKVPAGPIPSGAQLREILANPQ
jgi:hypothetical protein